MFLKTRSSTIEKFPLGNPSQSGNQALKFMNIWVLFGVRISQVVFLFNSRNNVALFERLNQKTVGLNLIIEMIRDSEKCYGTHILIYVGINRFVILILKIWIQNIYVKQPLSQCPLDYDWWIIRVVPIVSALDIYFCSTKTLIYHTLLHSRFRLQVPIVRTCISVLSHYYPYCGPLCRQNIHWFVKMEK